MISYLKGRVLKKEEDTIILEANSVGWLINVGSQSYLVLEEIEIYVHTHVRENDITLWGFRNYDELKIFKLLLDVSGVGPKSAMSILNEKGVKQILHSISNQNPSGLKVSGVGTKTSEKIIIDLKNKVKDIINSMSLETADGIFNESNNEIYTEAFDALESLGYQPIKIKRCLEDILKSDDKNFSSQELIKMALAKL